MVRRLKPKRVDLLFAVQEDDLNITYKGSRIRFISCLFQLFTGRIFFGFLFVESQLHEV